MCNPSTVGACLCLRSVPHDTLKTAFTVPRGLITSLERAAQPQALRPASQEGSSQLRYTIRAELRLRSPDTFSLQWWELNPGSLHVELHLSPKTDLGTRKLLISKYKFMYIGSEFKLHH